MQGAGTVEQTLTAPVQGALSVSVKAPALMMTVMVDAGIHVAVATVTWDGETGVRSELLSGGGLLEWPEDEGGMGSFQTGGIQVNHFGRGRVIIGDGGNVTFRNGQTYVSGRNMRTIEPKPMPTLALRVPVSSSLVAEVEAGRISAIGPYPLAALTANTKSADVDSQTPIGSLNAHTMSGDVTMRAALGQAQINTMSGDIRLAEARGPVSAQTMSGDIEATAPEPMQMNLGSMSGDVRAQVPYGSERYVLASTMSGDKSVRGF
jgi:hypothetical protein